MVIPKSPSQQFAQQLYGSSQKLGEVKADVLQVCRAVIVNACTSVGPREAAWTVAAGGPKARETGCCSRETAKKQERSHRRAPGCRGVGSARSERAAPRRPRASKRARACRCRRDVVVVFGEEAGTTQEQQPAAATCTSAQRSAPIFQRPASAGGGAQLLFLSCS